MAEKHVLVAAAVVSVVLTVVIGAVVVFMMMPHVLPVAVREWREQVMGEKGSKRMSKKKRASRRRSSARGVSLHMNDKGHKFYTTTLNDVPGTPPTPVLTVIEEHHLVDKTEPELEQSPAQESSFRRQSKNRNSAPEPRPSISKLLPSFSLTNVRSENMISEHRLLKCTLRPHGDLTSAVAFSPRGQYVATGGGNVIRLVVRKTLSKHEQLHNFQEVLLPEDDWVVSLQFSSPSGFFLVAGTGGGMVFIFRVYEQVGKKPVLEAKFRVHACPVSHLYMAMAPGSLDNKFFMVTGCQEGDNYLRFWTWNKSGARKPKLTTVCATQVGESGCEIKRLQVSNSNRKLAVIVNQEGQSQMKLFGLNFSPKNLLKSVHVLRAELGEHGCAHDVDFGQRTSVLATTEQDSWSIYKVKASGISKVKSHPGSQDPDKVVPYGAVAMAEFRRCIVVAKSCNLSFFQMLEGQDPKLVAHVEGAMDSDIWMIKVSPEEDSVATIGTNSSSVRLWNIPA